MNHWEIYFGFDYFCYLNQPFFSVGVIFSFSVCSILTAFLKAKLASTTVTIEMKNRPEIPIICSLWEGSLSPCKKKPKANQKVVAAIVKK